MPDANFLNERFMHLIAKEKQLLLAYIEEKLEAIPAEDRSLYEVRIRRHRDFSETASVVLKSAPILPCRCEVCR
jgi:hypothetical protein